jgi:hypothetical protein
MQSRAAAHYLGISETKLRGLGLPCKEDGGNVLYDRNDLDAYADRLPYRGIPEGNSCDGAFGRAS